MAVRPAHAMALCGVSLALLLLLAWYPPSAAPHRPRPAPARRRPLPRRLPATVPSPAPPSPPASSTAPPVPAPAPAPASAPRARQVMTRDLYVSGHSSPHPQLCPSLGARLKLLVLVSSAPAHRSARDAIRLTWGHCSARSDVALAFFLGLSPPELARDLSEEDALYGDLVRGSFVDSYSNLTLKTISMLEWTDAYCPRTPRLLKTDDDMFINVPRLLEFSARRANATRTLWGKVVRKSLPKRTTQSKYYLSPLQYPERVLPDFATGPAYLVTGDAVRPLYEAALREPYLRLEDVYVTGVLARRVGLARVHEPGFYNKKVSAHPCAVQRGLAIHMVRYHEQFDLWRKLLDGRTKCAH